MLFGPQSSVLLMPLWLSPHDPLSHHAVNDYKDLSHGHRVTIVRPIMVLWSFSSNVLRRHIMMDYIALVYNIYMHVFVCVCVCVCVCV